MSIDNNHGENDLLKLIVENPWDFAPAGAILSLLSAMTTNAIQSVEQGIISRISSAIGISPDLLAVGAESSSAAEIGTMIDEFSCVLRRNQFQLEIWEPTSFFIIYLRRRPYCVLYGTGSHGYTEVTVTKRGWNSRSAQKWGRAMMTAHMLPTVVPTWLCAEMGYNEPKFEPFRLVDESAVDQSFPTHGGRFEVVRDTSGLAIYSSITCPDPWRRT